MLAYVRGCVVALLVSACAGCGGNGTPASTCPGPQTLALSGYSTGSVVYDGGIARSSGPYPTTASYLYFSVTNVSNEGSSQVPYTETGTPILTGSDGSTIDGGALSPEEATAVVSISLFGYSSSIAGLKPNVTYAITFPSLQISGSGCSYPGQSVGSFATN